MKQNKNMTKLERKEKKENWKIFQWVMARNSFQSGSPWLKSRDCPLFLISLFIENQGGGVEFFNRTEKDGYTSAVQQRKWSQTANGPQCGKQMISTQNDK